MQTGGGNDMGLKIKSLASAAALGFALLAFAPAAKAEPAVVNARFAPVAHHGHYGHGHAYVRPYRPYYRPRVAYGYPYAYAAPYPVVRVFVALPFPHWVYRPAYTAPYASYPYAGAYVPH
jgi:hypothetical protein